jgi:uncharacterized metal-binding protein YceD (DUF177 family)
MEMQQMLERLLARQARFEENMAAKQEDFLPRMDKKDAKMAKADKQEGMLTEINAKMDATIQCIRSEVQETIHNRVENVREELNKKKTEALRIELTDTYNDLQAVKTSFDKHTTGVMDTIRDTREHLEIKFISFKDQTRSMISTNQYNIE